MKRYKAAVIMLAGVFMALSLLTTMNALAAGSTTFSLKVQSYSGGGYTDITFAEPGSVVRVAVSAASVPSFGGIRFSLRYDASKMDMRLANSECLIYDAKGLFNYSGSITGSVGTAKIIWDTTSPSTPASGTIFAFYFVVKSSPGNAGFTMTVDELWDGARSNIGWNSGEDISASVAVSQITIPQADLAVFRKLQTIRYPESLPEITAAQTLFATYSPVKAAVFQAGYPAEYSWLVNASSEYYRLAAEAEVQKVEAEANGFLTRNAAALALTAGTVKLSDRERVLTAAEELARLSSQALAKISADTKNLVKALKAKVEELYNAAEEEREEAEQAQSDAADFIRNYALLWTLTPKDVQDDFEVLPTVVLEALAIHDGMLSPTAQQLVKPQKARLDALKAEIDRLTANNEKEKKTLAAVQSFQRRWVDVLALTIDTVDMTDKKALETMIKDIDAQDPDVRARLSASRAAAESLMKAAESMGEELLKSLEELGVALKDLEKVLEGLDGNPQPEPSPGPGNSGGSSEPSGGEPGESSGGTESDPSGGGSGTVSGPGDGGGSKTGAAVVVRGIPPVIQILAISFGVLLLLAVYPASVLVGMMRRGEFMKPAE